MSSDLDFTLFLLGIGLRNFSVAHPVIPDLKKLIRTVSIEDAKAVAEKALTFTDAVETLEYLKSEKRRVMPDAP